MSDPRFFDTLIYICQHTTDGAWGFIINQPLSLGSVGSVLQEFGVPSPTHTMHTPAMHGGFVYPEAGFVLHTGLPNFKASVPVGENVCLTTSKDILKHLGKNTLSHYMLLMGFCQWSKGQLDEELKQGDWLVCPCDLQILFRADFKDRLALARQKIALPTQEMLPVVGRA